MLFFVILWLLSLLLYSVVCSTAVAPREGIRKDDREGEGRRERRHGRLAHTGASRKSTREKALPHTNKTPADRAQCPTSLRSLVRCL